MPLIRARKHRRTRVVQVVALGLTGLMLSMAAFYITRLTDLDRVQAMMELRVEWRARDIERKLALIGKSAEALAIYVAAEGQMTAARFHEFARLSHDRTGYDSALFWSPWVNGPDRAGFVDAARREGIADYDIRETGPDGTIVPAAPRPQYLPRLYEETFDHAPGISGFDLLSRPDRRILADRVRDTATPRAAAPFALPRDSASAQGFFVLWPVYTTGIAPPSVEARRAGFRGIAVARFRLDNVLPALIADTPNIIEAIDIASGPDGGSAQPVASFDPVLKRFVFGNAPATATSGGMTLVRAFSVFGQHWVLRSHFAPETIFALTSSAPWAWLIVGLVTTAMLILYVWWQTVLLGAVEGVASETDHRFRRLFDENPIGMVIATADEFRFIQVNAAFCRMLEYTPEELVGHVRDEFAAPGSFGMPPALTSGSDHGWHPTDKHYVCRSGKVITARVRAMRLAPSASGDVLVLGLAEDVTEQRKLEGALRQAQKMEAIGQLTGGMAHDFNNILGIIIGNLDLLQALLEDHADAGELVDEALAAALRGADLTRHLLAFARRQPLNPNRIALNEQIIAVTKLLTRTLGERIRISLDLAPDIWPVMADPVQLEACIINLATNARDAMPNGGTLTIATANRQLDADYAESHVDVTEGDYALIEISDSGTGMTAEVVAQIFEPFFTTKGQGKGTGLGLSMVFGFLKQSNGHISAYSEPGVGSTFRLYLPRVGGAADERPTSAAGELRRGRGETVLVVEDSEPLRRVVVRQLNDLGYAVIEADGADAALTVLARQPIALVFTDIVMPGELDGFGLANSILTRWPATKVLLTSGFPETKINGKLGAAAASARLLGKPYRTNDLARVVREVLES
jgi:PAS domain S-box-containing protein